MTHTNGGKSTSDHVSRLVLLFSCPQKSFNETISIFSPKYREVLASRSVLDMEDRTDWKACKLSKEKEKKLTAEFRKKYQPFDISL